MSSARRNRSRLSNEDRALARDLRGGRRLTTAEIGAEYIGESLVRLLQAGVIRLKQVLMREDDACRQERLWEMLRKETGRTTKEQRRHRRDLQRARRAKQRELAEAMAGVREHDPRGLAIVAAGGETDPAARHARRMLRASRIGRQHREGQRTRVPRLAVAWRSGHGGRRRESRPRLRRQLGRRSRPCRAGPDDEGEPAAHELVQAGGCSS